MLTSFRVGAEKPRRFEDSQGETWLAGQTVLKRAWDAEQANWVADLLADLPENGFRLSRPIPSMTGEWIADGWTAWTLEKGNHDTTPTRWPEVLQVSRHLGVQSVSPVEWDERPAERVFYPTQLEARGYRNL